MARWQPDTQERLVAAALELYTEQGYERTTVGQIAGHAHVTARTYFRYFADKREVLFASGETLTRAIAEGTIRALPSHRPFEAILIGITESHAVFQPRAFVVAREAVINTSEELRERELLKTAAITDALATILVDAGSDRSAARMTAEAGVSVMTASIRRWQDGDDAPFGELVQETADALRAATAPPPRH